MAKRLAKKVLLVGWGSADWKVINPLVEAGKLPNIAKLLEEGTRASMSALDPPTLPANWTSLVTGKIPGKHNVYGFTEIQDGKIYPVSANQRKSKALWNILSDHGLKVHQVGAWTSHPAEKINGISISDWFAHSSPENLSDQAIYPQERKADFAALISSAESVSEETLNAYLNGSPIDSAAFKEHCESLKTFIAHVETIQAAALNIIESEEWDQVSVFFSQLSNLTFKFMPYHLQHNKKVDSDLKTAFKNVLTTAYQKLDENLGLLLEKAGEETTLFLVSQGGYLPDPKWIEKLNRMYSTWEYNTPSVLIFRGINSSQKEEFFGVTILDIIPTILVLLGLPFAKDFNGKVILARKYFEEVNQVVDSYEKVTDVKSAIPITGVAETLLQEQLQDLGYVANSTYHLKEQYDYLQARIDMSVGQQVNALPVLEDLWNRYPDNSWYGGRLTGCLLSLNQIEEAAKLLDTVLEIGDEIPELHMLKAQFYMSEMKFRSAVKEMDIVEKNIGLLPNIYLQIAENYLKMNQWKEGVKRFNIELKHNPHPAAYMGLAMVYIQNKRLKQAIVPLQKCVEMMPSHPVAQFHLGNALYQTEDYEGAAEAFEISKKYLNDPKGQTQIQQRLIKLYRDHLNRPDKIREMREAYEKNIGSRGTITIVSGLPRSGTSMMMQMLVKGGLEAFTDGKREADGNNEKGYYEHEAVKSLARDKTFLKEVNDKVIKIISHLLHHLPHAYKYKIVFLDRAIEEVMHSQHKMLGRLGKERGADKEKSLRLLKPFKESREKAIKWCETNGKFVELLVVPYHEAINNPLEQAKKVNAFLGGDLDELAMASVVDKSLYREKSVDIIEGS